MKILNTIVRFDTIFKKGIKTINDDFFVAFITGRQGSGKNFFACMLLDSLPGRTIITNVHSLIIPNRKIHYITKLDEVYSINDDSCIFLFDELSKKFPKECKQDLRFYSWLQQSRKHKRYVYMITQEYIQVPTWLRGVANKVYTTQKMKILPFFKTSLGNPVLNEETKEWETENYLYFVYKRVSKYANMYDTFETIESL